MDESLKLSKYEIVGISNDMKFLIIKFSDDVMIPVEIGLQSIADVLKQNIPIVKKETSEEGVDTWVEDTTVEALDITSELLEKVILKLADLTDFVEESFDSWDEGTQERVNKEDTLECFHVAFISLLDQLEIAVERENFKDQESTEEESKELTLRRCPHCHKYTFCNKYGDREVYCGYGGYDYYATCKNCGREFLVYTTSNKVEIIPDPEGAYGPHYHHHDPNCPDQECHGHDHYYHDSCYDNHYNDSFSDDGMHHYEDAELDKEKGLQ